MQRIRWLPSLCALGAGSDPRLGIIVTPSGMGVKPEHNFLIMSPTFPHKYLTIPVSEETRNANRAAGICVMYRCRRRAKVKKGGVCNTCASRLARLADPVHYAYTKVKRSAQKRGIAFSISLDEWRVWCEKTAYHDLCGNTAWDMTVNRKDPRKGYSIENIEIMANSHNASRRFDPVPMTDVCSEEELF